MAVKLDPTGKDHIELLGMAYYRAGKYQLAVELNNWQTEASQAIPTRAGRVRRHPITAAARRLITWCCPRKRSIARHRPIMLQRTPMRHRPIARRRSRFNRPTPTQAGRARRHPITAAAPRRQTEASRVSPTRAAPARPHRLTVAAPRRRPQLHPPMATRADRARRHRMAETSLSTYCFRFRRSAADIGRCILCTSRGRLRDTTQSLEVREPELHQVGPFTPRKRLFQDTNGAAIPNSRASSIPANRQPTSSPRKTAALAF
jgi:hypothetical protein